MSENKGEDPSAAIKLFGKTIQLPTTDAEAETHETATATVSLDHNNEDDDDVFSLCNSEELHLQRNNSFDTMLTSTTSLSLLDASTNNKDAIRVTKRISDPDNHQAIINPTVAAETEINKSTSTTSTALPPPYLPPLHQHHNHSHNQNQNQSRHHHPIQGGSTSVVNHLQINNTTTNIIETSSTNYKQLEEDHGHREITSCSTPSNHKKQLLLIRRGGGGGGGGGEGVEVEASASATSSSSLNEKLEKKKERQEKVEKPHKTLPCPRCNSMDTKFCYFNNYNLNQPRHFCKSCQRYWTSGGSMRNVPIGAGRRKNKNMITMNMTTTTTACSNFHLLPHPIFIPKTAASINISSPTTTSTSTSNGFIYPSTPNPIHRIPNPANYNLMMGSKGGGSTAGTLLGFASSSDPPPPVPHPHLPPLKVCDESMVSSLNLADNQSMMMITDKEDKKKLGEEEAAATCFHVGVGGFSPSLSSLTSSSSSFSSVVVPHKVLVPCNFPASLSPPAPAPAPAPSPPPWNSSWGPPFQLPHPWSNYSPNKFLPIANPVIGVPPPLSYNNNNYYWGCNWSTSSPSSVWLTTTDHHHKQQLISNPPDHDQYNYQYSASSSTTSLRPNSSTSLGKHSRNGIILHNKHVVVDAQDDDHEATDIDHHKRSSSSSDHNHKVLVPKTLRVNDPNAAHEKISSIWATLGITTTTTTTTTTSTTNVNNNNLKQLMGGDDDQDHHTDLIINNNNVNNQVSLFKGFEESSSSSSKERKMFNGSKGSLSDGRHSLLLQANPAALSRSLKFRESAD